MELRDDYLVTGGSEILDGITEDVNLALRLVHDGSVVVADTVEVDPVEELPSPFELFRDNLHATVINLEVSGQSALGYLDAVTSDLRNQRTKLVREEIKLHYALNSVPPDEQSVLIDTLCAVQQEQLSIFHQLEWAEGYRKDPSRLH
jgi:hypothetical protein